jgi:transposase-like protein
MAARPWTDTDQARLLELHAAGQSLHSIAKQLGRSKETISRKATAAGLTWDRTRTAAAAQAVTIDNKARRAALESKLLAKADDLINAIDSPFLAFSFGGKDNTYNEHHLDRPPTSDIRNLMQSAGIAIDRSLKLADHDSGAAGAAVIGLLQQTAAALGLRDDQDVHTP